MQKLIKVFGERNTSTNVFCTLLERNFCDIKVLPSTISDISPSTASKVRKMRHEEGDDEAEELVDQVFLQAPELYFWKHCATYFQDHSIFNNVNVVIMVRHPASWLLALHKRPYHALQDIEESFLDFLTQPWKTTKRDLLGECTLTPLDLWNRKVESYFKFSKKLPRDSRIDFVKFEDFAVSQRSVVERMSGSLGVNYDEVSFVEKSTKDSSKSAEWYSDYYGNERWRDRITQEQASIINQGVSSKMMEWLSYDYL